MTFSETIHSKYFSRLSPENQWLEVRAQFQDGSNDSMLNALIESNDELAIRFIWYLAKRQIYFRVSVPSIPASIIPHLAQCGYVQTGALLKQLYATPSADLFTLLTQVMLNGGELHVGRQFFANWVQLVPLDLLDSWAPIVEMLNDKIGGALIVFADEERCEAFRTYLKTWDWFLRRIDLHFISPSGQRLDFLAERRARYVTRAFRLAALIVCFCPGEDDVAYLEPRPGAEPTKNELLALRYFRLASQLPLDMQIHLAKCTAPQKAGPQDVIAAGQCIRPEHFIWALSA